MALFLSATYMKALTFLVFDTEVLKRYDFMSLSLFNIILINCPLDN